MRYLGIGSYWELNFFITLRSVGWMVDSTVGREVCSLDGRSVVYSQRAGAARKSVLAKAPIRAPIRRYGHL